MAKHFSNLWKCSVPFGLIPCCVYLFSSLLLTQHTHTHSHSVTPPLHKSACHGGDIACMQSRFIKRMTLFYFFSPPLPISAGYLTSLSWQPLRMTCLCQAPCISEVLFSSLSATDNDKKNDFRQLPATTVKFITGDKWGYYPCCQAGRSEDTRQLQV